MGIVFYRLGRAQALPIFSGALPMFYHNFIETINLEKKYNQYKTGKHDITCGMISSPVLKLKFIKHFL